MQPAVPEDGAGPVQPTVQYEEALAHAGDRTAFMPGGRVTVPFKPRAARSLDGRRRHAAQLPAGRLSGKAIRDGVAAPAAIRGLGGP